MPVGTTTHLAIAGREYIVKPGSYVKRQAPQFGARFATGDPDYNNLSMWQHWGQNCFIGGVDQEEFQDDAMYDEGVGVDTFEHKRVTLSRDLARGSGLNWTLGGTAVAAQGYKAIVYNGVLYVLTFPTTGVSQLWSYSPGTDGWTRVTSFDTPAVTARSIATNDGKLFIGGVANGTTTPKLVYSSGALAAWTVRANPAGVPTNRGIYAMRSFQQRLYVAFGTSIWRLKDDQTWDGSTVFYKADMDSESNYIIAMETHLGFLYMLSQNGHIHRTDGNATFDIWSWDGQTQGSAIRSFDGRLFVLTFEFTNTGDAGYGCLYQMSGSAVTQLKRWGNGTSATRIPNMTVHDRKLFYGASNLLGFGARLGFGVAGYDPIEDAHAIVASNSDTVTYASGAAPYTNFIVDEQFFFGGFMFVFVRGFGGFKTVYRPFDFRANGRFYDSSAAGVAVGSKNGGWFTTSTYDAGTPGVKKLWRKVVIDYRLPSVATSILPEYSVDGGQTWVALAALTTTNGLTNQRGRFEYWLNNIIGTSLKLRFTLRTTGSSQTPIFYGFVVSYIPIPEPNWIWSFTIPLATTIQNANSTGNLAYDTEAEMLFLENTHRSKVLVSFTDIDGKIWASNGPGVLIHDIEFRVPQMTQPLEGDVIITLLEAVETY